MHLAGLPADSVCSALGALVPRRQRSSLVILERDDILARIPHRPPFLFVDRIEILQDGLAAVGTVALQEENPIFGGHFPGRPIVPGVLMIECVAQVAAALFSSPTEGDPDFRGRWFAGVEAVRFKRPVHPGQTMRVEARVDRRLGRFVKVRGRIRCEDAVAMEGTIVLYNDDAPASERPESGQ